MKRTSFLTETYLIYFNWSTCTEPYLVLPSFLSFICLLNRNFLWKRWCDQRIQFSVRIKKSVPWDRTRISKHSNSFADVDFDSSNRNRADHIRDSEGVINCFLFGSVLIRNSLVRVCFRPWFVYSFFLVTKFGVDPDLRRLCFFLNCDAIHRRPCRPVYGPRRRRCRHRFVILTWLWRLSLHLFIDKRHSTHDRQLPFSSQSFIWIESGSCSILIHEPELFEEISIDCFGCSTIGTSPRLRRRRSPRRPKWDAWPKTRNFNLRWFLSTDINRCRCHTDESLTGSSGRQ